MQNASDKNVVIPHDKLEYPSFIPESKEISSTPVNLNAQPPQQSTPFTTSSTPTTQEQNFQNFSLNKDASNFSNHHLTSENISPINDNDYLASLDPQLYANYTENDECAEPLLELHHLKTLNIPPAGNCLFNSLIVALNLNINAKPCVQPCFIPATLYFVRI